MPRNQLPQHLLHVRLLKPSASDFDSALEDPDPLRCYSVRRGLGFQGRLYVAPPSQSPPPWLEFVQTGVRDPLRELTNRTNQAVLLVRRARRLFAFTFGHGRHLLRDALLVPDFGIKAALNALRQDSLRSVDTFTIEDQTLHTRAQASRASGMEVFGLDISRDILRAVTGNPRAEVPFRSVSGSEATLAIAARTDFPGLGAICDTVLRLYGNRDYREHFSWVDNVRRVGDPDLTGQLDQLLLRALQATRGIRPYLAPPEPIEWQEVAGFAYTRQPHLRDPELDLHRYLQRPPRGPVTIEHLKRDRIHAFSAAIDDVPKYEWPLYKCLVLEASHGNRRFVLTTGAWFEVDRDFAARIRRSVASIPVSDITLDPVQAPDGVLESEAAYNARAASGSASIALMDRKTAACRNASSPIEFCDLITTQGHLVHVKHRKGGSSSLSHLFAQARVSAEALLSDEGFRSEVRQYLRDLGQPFLRQVPVRKPDPARYTIVFAILGAEHAHPAEDIPFFSQLNLARTSDALASMGFKVQVLGLPTADMAG